MKMSITNSQVAIGIEDTMRKPHPLGLGSDQNVSDAIHFCFLKKIELDYWYKHYR